MDVDIERIDHTSPYLGVVKALGRAASATLGFLPDGAFDDYAKKGHIIVALDSQRDCIGYLLYRINNRASTVAIVHLCVAAQHRGKGVARQLADRLKGATRQYRGIQAWCRRDYPANEVWPRLDFAPIWEKPGRGTHAKPLTLWWYDHGHPNLFTSADRALMQSSLTAVIDVNVMYDLQDPIDNINEESKALQAPWLSEHLLLWRTREIFNEIDRNNVGAERERRRRFAQTFPEIGAERGDLEAAKRQLRPLFPAVLTPQDQSDLQHLAWTLAGGAQFFVTRDEALRQMTERPCAELGLRVARPCDLILQFDEVLRDSEYQPVRVAASPITCRRVQAGEEEMVTSTFLNMAGAERKAQLTAAMRRVLADPQSFEARLFQRGTEPPLGFAVYDRTDDTELKVPIMRVRRSSLSGTLARHMVFSAIRTAEEEGRALIDISDKHLPPDIIGAMTEDGFAHTRETWRRIVLSVVDTASGLAVRLRALAENMLEQREYIDDLATMLEDASRSADVDRLVDIERVLWPAKIADLDVPTFIVPIRAYWAAELFDEQLAHQTLLHTKPELILNYENAYYCTKKGGIKAPGRILWYVSKEQAREGSMQVRACSRLDEVVVGKPKNVFSRLRRLGVYEFRNVLDIAKGDFNSDIMALRFSATEHFSAPIPFADLKRVRNEEDGKHSPIQAPTPISSQCFFRLYKMGREME